MAVKVPVNKGGIQISRRKICWRQRANLSNSSHRFLNSTNVELRYAGIDTMHDIHNSKDCDEVRGRATKRHIKWEVCFLRKRTAHEIVSI